MITRYLLVEPLLQGAFLSGSWAKILTRHIIQHGKQAIQRELLPSVLSMYDVKLVELKLSDGSPLWKTFVTIIVPKRNAIAHDGEGASPDEADLALECASTLRKEVVAQVAKKMDFDLEKNRSWHNHVDADAMTYEPKLLFEQPAPKKPTPPADPQQPKGFMKFLTRRGN